MLDEHNTIWLEVPSTFATEMNFQLTNKKSNHILMLYYRPRLNLFSSHASFEVHIS